MILARAPFRITLGGGGTDLPSYYRRYGGFVLSAAIDKYLYIGVNRPPADDLIRVKYSRSEEVDDLSQIKHDLVRPALQQLGVTSNIEIVSLADVPAGTGLGSSSAYLVALLTALYELKRQRVPARDVAENAFRIEAELAGHPVGKQDHYLAALGGITCLEIAPDGSVEATPLKIPSRIAEKLRSRLLLFFTNVSRGANTILETQRTQTESGVDDVVESLHETKRIGLEIRDALVRGAVEDIGVLMDEHWQVKKLRSASISSGGIDRWYDRARDAGALGGKIVGAGGGGFLMVFCPPHATMDVRRELAQEGLTEMAYEFEWEGAKVLGRFR